MPSFVPRSTRFAGPEIDLSRPNRRRPLWILLFVIFAFASSREQAVAAIPGYIVNVSTDPATGTAANCGANSSSCSLRDALAAATMDGGANISFDPAVFNTATAINLSGTLSIPSGTSIVGPTNSDGPLVTLTGNYSFIILYIDAPVTGASISGLAITGGEDVDGIGAGISNLGSITIDNCNIYSNTITYTAGGGIFNSGTLVLSHSTVSNNNTFSGLYLGGGIGIANTGTMTITASTISNNIQSANSDGGAGIDNSYNATMTVLDSAVTGNTIPVDNPLGSMPAGAGINNSGNLTLINDSIAGNTNSMGNAGGLQNSGTLLAANNVIGDNFSTGPNEDANPYQPLGEDDCDGVTCPSTGTNGNVVGVGAESVAPGSMARCAGLTSKLPADLVTDIRGAARTTVYATSSGSITCVDAGAYQMHFALSFTQQPPASVQQNAPFYAMVSLTEYGTVAIDPISMSLATGNPGTLLNGAGIPDQNGIADFTNLLVTKAGADDALVATIPITSVPPPPSVNLPISLSTVSNVFNVASSNYVLSAFGTNPLGFTFSVDGVSYNSTVTLGGFVPGSTHAISTTTPQTMIGETYSFSSWSDGGAISHNFSAAGGAGLTASFLPLGSATVNTTDDDATGTPANCMKGSGVACTLRDAVAAAATETGGIVSFDPTVFATTQSVAARTITLTNGPLSLGNNTTINGPTAGTGSTFARLVTVSGNNQQQIFSVNGSNVVIDGLNLINGNDAIGSGGGAISNFGSLTVENTSISGSTSITYGGAISNNYYDSVTIDNSFISGNSANYVGAGIENQGGSVVITNSTFANNAGSAIDSQGGSVSLTSSTLTGNLTGISIAGTYIPPDFDLANAQLTVANSTIIVDGNEVGFYIEVGGVLTVRNSVISGNLTPSTGAYCSGQNSSECPPNGTNGNLVNANLMLNTLGNYGGPTPTILPLPGSPVICAGSASGLPSTDQRGLPRKVTYSSNQTCVDSGATQTDYSLNFSAQPPATVGLNQNFTAGVQLMESGNPLAASGITVPLTLGSGSSGTLSGGSATTGSDGIATYSSLKVNADGSGDTLAAVLTITSTPPLAPLTSAITVSATSNAFTVGTSSQTITFPQPASPVVYGAAPVSLSATASSGLPVTFSVLSGPGVVNGNTLAIMGVGNIVIAANQPGNADYSPATQVTQTLVVTKGILTVTANNFSRTYGTPNPTFAGTVNGATSGDSFTESFTTSANTASNAGTYSIVPSVMGANLADYSLVVVVGTLTVTQAASATMVTASTPTADAGASVTFTVTVASSTTGEPTGSVQFLNGSTILGTSPLNGQGTATYTSSALPAGSSTIKAMYSGDTNFAASSGVVTQVVTAASFTLTADPSQITIHSGQSGKVTITLTPAGGYKGSADLSCSGLPQDAGCSFTPATLTADGSDKVVTSTLSISTGQSGGGMAKSNQKPGPTLNASFVSFPALLSGLVLCWSRKRLTSLASRSICVIVMLTGLAASMGLSACGGGTLQDSPKGTSTVSIIAASSGGMSQTFQLKVIITK